MNSPTHTLMAMAAFSKKGQPLRNWAVFIGSLIPDAFIYFAWVWLTFIKGESQRRIWDEIYFQAPMQLTASIFNSVPLYALLGFIGYVMWRAKDRWAPYALLLLVFALAALLHITFDFPVHNHDAYAHFWPISEWRFISPLSYYEREHHAGFVGVVGCLLALGAIYVLWKRFPAKWVRRVLILFGSLYLLLQLAFWLGPIVGG